MNALIRDLKKNAFVTDLLSRCDFVRVGTPAALAVSGGMDSMAMLILAAVHGCDVTAIHVDHGLRVGSDQEATIIKKLAMQLDAKFQSKTISVEHGPNLEARARAARYQALPHDVMTGHTADDQAETILINLLRGAGLSGLAGMRQGLRHPILSLRRSETHQLCETLEIECVNDISNSDPKFLRNRIRHELIPLIDSISQRDVAPILSRQSQLFRNESDLLDDLASTVDPTDAIAIAALPPALARRAIRKWLTDIYPPDADTVERVLEVAHGLTTGCEIGQNRQVRRSKQRLAIIDKNNNS